MPSEPPAPIVPVPASQFSTLRGRRVIVGVPGLGFRADLRADDPAVQGSRTYVPVLTEEDFYRAETEQTEVFAPLVPIERVWVEYVADEPTPAPDRPSTLDAPGRRIPAAVSGSAQLLGRRLVEAVPDGHARDLRACTDVYLNRDAEACVRVCAEAEWYRWARSGTTPATTEVPADRLWLE
jgi:hypothetical protein